MTRSPPAGPLRSSRPARAPSPGNPIPPGAVARTEILCTSKRVGRTIWRRWGGYHRGWGLLHISVRGTHFRKPEGRIGVMSFCRFRGYAAEAVTGEPEIRDDATEVQPRVQNRGGEARDEARDRAGSSGRSGRWWPRCGRERAGALDAGADISARGVSGGTGRYGWIWPRVQR